MRLQNCDMWWRFFENGRHAGISCCRFGRKMKQIRNVAAILPTYLDILWKEANLCKEVRLAIYGGHIKCSTAAENTLCIESVDMEMFSTYVFTEGNLYMQ